MKIQVNIAMVDEQAQASAAALLPTLPSGNYLCACCPEERREETRARLTETVRTAAGREPAFGVQFIRVNGILKWDYEIQVFCGEEKVSEDAILP